MKRHDTQSDSSGSGKTDCDVLHGWKAIATYAGIGVRTAQRWEAWGLPVRRPRMGIRSNVVAIPHEIWAWLHAAPVNLIDEITRLKARIEQLEAELSSLRPTRSQASRQVAEAHNPVLPN